ncbi:MAG TPA: sulfotransferase [Acidimicrobiales bacterium]|nr:sulfotransferase [Acidimicrobiales bacterium]
MVGEMGGEGSRKSRAKVFCIGFNKTGTMTLHRYFELAGLDSSHDAMYQKQTRTLGQDELRSYLDAHDAFTDGERADYSRLAELYPDAKFILNTRGLKKWLESRVKHVFRQGGAALADPDSLDRPQPGFWSGPMAREYLNDPERAISDWVDRREFYHRAVIAFFDTTKPDDFIVVNITRNPTWQEDLDAFLGLAVRGRVREPIHQNTASANMSAYGLPERLQQVESVLHQKNIPTAEWENETFIGRG